MMFCEAYRCNMSKYACMARRRNALNNNHAQCKKPGFGDVVCKACEQGAAVAAELDPKEAEKYSADLNQIRKEAWRNTHPRKKTDIPVPIEEPAAIETTTDPIVRVDKKPKRGRPAGSRNKPAIKKATCSKVGNPDIVSAIEKELEHHIERAVFFNSVLKELTGNDYIELQDMDA